MIGRTLAHYEILEKVGAGGMGEVYRARDRQLGRDVAVKVLPPEWSRDTTRVRRFEREARTLAGLEHPNIATVYGFHESDGVHLLAMELIRGSTLASRVSDGGLPLGALLDIGIPIAEAMAFAHERGVVHRDLKPANVMLDTSGRPRILDFGVAGRVAGATGEDAGTIAETLSAEGAVVGTIAYMAPEQLLGQPVDGRADVFSLGVLLYELASGTRPFRGDTTAGLVSAVLRDDPVPLRERRPDLPPDLERVLRRCLAKRPERRLQTALDLRNELEDLRDGIRTDAATDSPSHPDPGALEEHQMTITIEQVRRLTARVPRMVGDVMTYLDNHRRSDVLLVCLHGLGWDQNEFEDLLRLSPYRTIALSNYGFGPSARARPPLPLGDHNLLVTFLIEEVVRQIQPRRLVLAGQSSGADQMLQIVGADEAPPFDADGLILLGQTWRSGPGFVSGPYSRMTDDPEAILDAVRSIAAVASDLRMWLLLHEYLLQALRKFQTDTAALRKFAQDLITMYAQEAFEERFRKASARVRHVRCVFGLEEHEESDLILQRHISDHVLGDHFSEETIVLESVGHIELTYPEIMLPHVEDVVRRAGG